VYHFSCPPRRLLCSSFFFLFSFFFLLLPPPPRSTLFPYTTLFRSLLPTLMKNINSKIGSRIYKLDTEQVNFTRGFIFYKASCFRSEEHTSELQSRFDLVCRLLLEKKKIRQKHIKLLLQTN